jgi:hypothetical protein
MQPVSVLAAVRSLALAAAGGCFRRIRSARCRATLATLATVGAGLALAPLPAAEPAFRSEWRAGVANVKITPPEPMAMAGYASRNRPSSGIGTDLFAKALALQHEQGEKFVIVTLDAHMVPGELREHVERAVAARHALEPRQLLVNASHTHCGPELRTDERFFESTGAQYREAAVRYRSWLDARLADLVGEALGRLAPCRLEHSHARAGFAMSRRRPGTDGRIALGAHPDGPVDHDVPVLKVTAPTGALQAVLFGYACHNTTFGGDEYQINGDYAGHAQAFVEAVHPGAAALFLTGCGGDQDPYPRVGMVKGRTAADFARQHGQALANAVLTALSAGLKPVKGPLRLALDQVDLSYQFLPRTEIVRRLEQEKSASVARRIRTVLGQLDDGTLPAGVPWPVQVARFGDDLVLIAIGGEVVVDYALRIKRELGGPARVWVAGYSNAGYAYIGTRRIIAEGGYEGYSANLRMMNHPGPWSSAVEETLMAKVHELWRRTMP